jgi:hypothetical protein
MDFAKKTFDQFGQYRRDYFVTRGNHDRRAPGRSTGREREKPGEADPGAERLENSLYSITYGVSGYHDMLIT